MKKHLIKKHIAAAFAIVCMISLAACSSGAENPMRTAALLQIVTEEAAAYYNGSRTISEVAQIIENRVGLYLKENAAD